MSVDRPIVRETATVVVTAPVDGSVRRRASGARRLLATRVEGFTVDARIMAAAHAALRPGERLMIVGPNEVRTVY
jgi:hypothetical protein